MYCKYKKAFKSAFQFLITIWICVGYQDSQNGYQVLEKWGLNVEIKAFCMVYNYNLAPWAPYPQIKINFLITKTNKVALLWAGFEEKNKRYSTLEEQ